MRDGVGQGGAEGRLSVGEPPGFARHAEFRGIGGCLATIVGPGPRPGTERVYASHIYGGSTFDLVAIDPDSGATEVCSGPAASEFGAWALALGPDGRVYVGTLPEAHLFRLDWARHELVDLGRPSAGEQYIWQLTVGTDRKVYGCTFPSARLVRYDPATGGSEDLGRMHPSEQYARTVAADDAGFVYCGIGMARVAVVAYEIATGRHRDILPPELAQQGVAMVHRGDDGRVYAIVGGQALRLSGFAAEPVSPSQARPAPVPTLADGRQVSYDGRRQLTLSDPRTGVTQVRRTDYAGKSQAICRLVGASDGELYGSTFMPVHFFRVDLAANQAAELAQLGHGSLTSLLAWNGQVLGGTHAGLAPLLVYQPNRDFGPAADPSGNPWLVKAPGASDGWWPLAMIAGPQQKVYVGAIAGYGLLGGPLAVWDPATGEVEAHHHLVEDQSVISLALLPDGTLVGGTTVDGGPGSHSTQVEARLFVWDPAARAKLYETVPLPGTDAIDALAIGPDGLVYAFATGRMAVFDAAARRVVEVVEHRLGTVVYGSVLTGPDGRLYGLGRHCVFTVDTATRRPRILAEYPAGIDGGVALQGQRIYFCSGARIVSYQLP